MGELRNMSKFNDRAWHADVSNFQGREKCNDFATGKELEECNQQPLPTLNIFSLQRAY